MDNLCCNQSLLLESEGGFVKVLLQIQMRHTCTLVAVLQVLDRGERLELLVSGAVCLFQSAQALADAFPWVKQSLHPYRLIRQITCKASPLPFDGMPGP